MLLVLCFPGTLLNSVVVEILQKILSLEDISTEDSAQLISLLSMTTEKAPALFTCDDAENTEQPMSSVALLHKYVLKWSRFKEMLLLLNCGLQEIDDRWADGKGPLAEEYTATEIKQFIRATFQNTEKRAYVLSRIS